jgi:putative redox protein
MANSARVVLRNVDPGAGSGLVFDAITETGRGFVMDSASEPEGVSPVDTLLAALGGCCAMDVIGILRKKRQDVTGYEVRVSGERREEHPRAFTSIELVHRVRGRNLSAVAIEEAMRLSDTKYCSVFATLAPAVPITSRYEIIAETT